LKIRPAVGKFLPDRIDPSHFTHINFAFGIFGFATRSVQPTNPRLTGANGWTVLVRAPARRSFASG
jgi:chitinase